ncbi:Pyruvate/Phosphoenolpyruvate kinase-like domain-containing protein [Mycena metata]|uniref:Pyruvate/Phosphoenolpyruvate kinase-like domain-containing protein n=1 Tax=Mycena metata TaxID=1033252 RepID=A0AAD7K6A1_9AGAR|nr:Pyruvate/Phosphoenolpyruvate kinase-like domain-containing protein [Mycena metata]
MKAASTKLRELLARDEILVLPGVYDGISARIALSEGFDALYMTGAGTSASVLGQPDLGIVTLNDMVGNAGMIAGLNPRVPVIADADTGFGGAAMCARTTTLYARGGVAGFHIEDQVQQKRCGHLASKQLVPLDEYLVRIRAAANARTTLESDIVLITRSDALANLGLDAAIARCKAALDAGADVAFVEGLRTREDAERAVRELAPAPVMLNLATGGLTPNWTVKEAQEMGFKLVIFPCAGMIPAALAVRDAYREIRAQGTDVVSCRDVGPRGFFEMVGLDEVVAIDAKAGGNTLGEA